MSVYRNQIAAALRAVTIRGPTRYAWLGRSSRPLPRSVDAELDGAERRSYLVACLREELYSSFYCHGGPVPARWGQPEPFTPDPWLAEAMSQANTGHGSWQPGWTVKRAGDDEAVVASPRVRARIRVRDCEALGGSVTPGAAVRVRLPKELRALSPGFYTVVSDATADLEFAGSVVRVYWNVNRAGAPALVELLASRLNAERAPFRLKVADHPFRLDRRDAAVLYLEGDAFRALRGALRTVATALSTRVRPGIPAFTLELAPGVGLAEDEGGESFGTRLCALLADGIVRGHEQGVMRIGDRIDAVAARFAENGIAADAPYLAPSLSGRHVL